MTPAEIAVFDELMSCNANACLTFNMQRLVAVVRLERAVMHLENEIYKLPPDTSGSVRAAFQTVQMLNGR